MLMSLEHADTSTREVEHEPSFFRFLLANFC